MYKSLFVVSFPSLRWNSLFKLNRLFLAIQSVDALIVVNARNLELVIYVMHDSVPPTPPTTTTTTTFSCLMFLLLLRICVFCFRNTFFTFVFLEPDHDVHRLGG